MENSKYGFKVGDLVETKVDIESERGYKIPKGSLIKIVAIAPKVRYTNKDLINKYPDRFDSKLYFFNAVIENFGHDRFRENFVTIKKIK